MSDVWRLLSSTSFFEKLCASESDWDSVLDAREDEGFDQLWTSHHAALLATPLTPEMTEGITRLREHAFKEVFSISRNADLAGYVSDDVGLIAHHMAVEAPASWVNGLLESYVRGEFPHEPFIR